MSIVAKVSSALHQLFGDTADSVGRTTKVVVRKRKFTALSLARTFVLGFLQNPQASDEELAQVAAQCGADVTPQAIDQRHTPGLVQFLEELFRRGTALVMGSDKSLAPLLERFTRVDVMDSSTITLPDSERERFRGCGGVSQSGQAAMKLQTELDLRSGAITHLEIEPGRSPDGASSRQHAERPAGSLRITDLGYFNLQVFAALRLMRVYFLSRLQFGTTIMSRDGKPLELLRWLPKRVGHLIDEPILLGKKEQLPCRLIAWRLPSEQANHRRQKLRQETIGKRGHEPCAERLAWCDWTILLTSVPNELLSAREAIVLYRARWQVELLFKRWKSQGLVAVLKGSTDVRKMVRVWARLIAALIQHWLLMPCAWGDPRRSLSKTCEAIRTFAARILTALDRRSELRHVLNDLCTAVANTCRRNKRSRPGTFELLNDISLLDFRLT